MKPARKDDDSAPFAKLQYKTMAQMIRAISLEVSRRNPIMVNAYLPLIDRAAEAVQEISDGEVWNFTSECGPREKGARK